MLEFSSAPRTTKLKTLRASKNLFDEATELSSLDPTVGISEFVAHFDSALLNDIDISTDKSSSIQNAIQLVTYHGSKGREFEHVYLPNLVAKNWEKFSMQASTNL